VFKRRKGGSEPEQAEQAEQTPEVEEVIVEQGAAVVADPGTGPFDISAAPDDELARVDLGGLQIPIVDNMQLHLEGHDEENNSFALAIIVLEERQAALQLMAVAAPRSGGFWEEVMQELENEITSSGGQMVRKPDGRFGPELVGNVPAQDAEGNTGLQAARFVGAEGPRWFIRGMFMGSAATDPGMGEFFEDIISGCIVNRGERPMAPGDLIPLTPPAGVETEEIDDDEADESGRFEDLEPFERGPEITETR
jgi:hypothetical protein